MTEEEQIGTLYRYMYEAMVAKDTVTLNRVHADDFVLTHMTGSNLISSSYESRNGKCFHPFFF